MAKKEKDASAKDGAKGGGMKEKLLPVVLLLVGVVVGSKVLGGGSTTIVQAAEPVTTAAAEAETEVVPLDPITLNLSDGHILKVGLALKKAVLPAAAAGGHGAAPAKDDPTKGYAGALDVAIRILGAGTYEELITPEGRAKVQDELAMALAEKTHDEVVGVYFWQFIVQ
jgi:flagellar FliL protein